MGAAHGIQAQHLQQTIGGVGLGRQVHAAADVTGVGRRQQERWPLPGAFIGGDPVAVGCQRRELGGEGAYVASLTGGPGKGVGAGVDGGVHPGADHGQGPATLRGEQGAVGA